MDNLGIIYHSLFILLQSSPGIINPEFALSPGFFLGLLTLIFLLFTSGFISGAETAFFAISPVQLHSLKESESTKGRLIFQLINKPKRLLATLLITINFINIAIVVLSAVLIDSVFQFGNHEVLGFIIQVVAVTFVIVLFCEVMPKVYAQQNAMRIAERSVFALFVLEKILRPFSWVLVKSTSLVEKRINKKGYDVSVDELTHAIDITSDKNTPEEEKKILKGIALFGNIDVKQIMKPRMDVIAFEYETKFSELFPLIIEHRYSRVPIYKETFDSIAGVLYIKDLLPHIEKEHDDTFNWQALIRSAYFVPESKKINDLLQEFQEKKIHLAIVVDEYGGSSGIVTLEDILEEIVGEINDEFDDDELSYSKLDDRNFVFEGKTLLNDLSRVMEVERKIFDVKNEEVDTLAGLILELKGSIPVKGEKIKLNDILFTIESADRRKIKRVKITLPEQENANEDTRDKRSGNAVSIVLLMLLSSLLLSSCDEGYLPKPRGFFRITMPEKNYHQYTPDGCPFSFDIPEYATVVKDTSSRAEPCFMNVIFPKFNGTIYLSYKKINNDLNELTEDHRSMTMKHIAKASAIDEMPINIPEQKIYGTMYSVKGSAASNVQFFVTDSTNNFLRGSLYFYNVPQPDSIAPVLDFIARDVDHLIQTLHWH